MMWSKGFVALSYLTLLLTPLAFISTVLADEAQDPIQESYGAGTYFLNLFITGS